MSYDPILVQRDCPGVLIPAGQPATIPAGSEVYLMQALGGTVTVNYHGNLVRVEGSDLDALGMDAEPDPVEQVLAAADSTEDAVWSLLATCYDPEIPINIVELGLIYSVELQPLPEDRFRAVVSMTLTAPGCGMGEFLVYDIRRKLERLPAIEDVDVDLVFDPPWNQSMMSEAARLQTGML